MAQIVKCLPTMQETWVQSLCREDPLEEEILILIIFHMDFLGGSDGKVSAYNM